MRSMRYDLHAGNRDLVAIRVISRDFWPAPLDFTENHSQYGIAGQVVFEQNEASDRKDLNRKLPTTGAMSQDPNTAEANVDPGLTSASAQALCSLPKIISFDSLARSGDEIWIENEGQIYRLRRTRQGKLILTK